MPTVEVGLMVEPSNQFQFEPMPAALVQLNWPVPLVDIIWFELPSVVGSQYDELTLRLAMSILPVEVLLPDK